MLDTLSKEKFHFKAFHDLDNSSEAEFLINSMEIISNLDDVQIIVRNAILNANIKEEDIILDVGCGLGYDAYKFLNSVGKTGKVIGVDISQKMIQRCQAKFKFENLNFEIGNCYNLDYPDNYFSCCFAHRLLVSHSDKDKIIQEMLRVTKPGGKIILIDVDALSISIAPYDEKTATIVKYIQGCFINPTIGRDLPHLLHKHNLHMSLCMVNTSIIQDFKILNNIFNFKAILADLIHLKKLSQLHAKEWQNAMLLASHYNYFVYTVNFYTSIGIKSKIKNQNHCINSGLSKKSPILIKEPIG